MGLIGEIWADARLHTDKASFAEYGSMLKQAEGQVSELSSFTQTALATAFTGIAATVTGIAAYGTTIASAYEDAGLTLKTLYGSQEAAQEKFQWLADFAATTPFEFPELLDAAVKLKAFGMDIEQYGRTIGDTAAAMGKPIEAVVEALADAQQGEFERMKEFGIKAVEIQKDNYEQLGATIQDVGKTALTYMDENGKQQIAVVDRNNKEMVTSTIDAIWNSKYAGAMEERSKSFNGLISTLKDNLKAGLADIVGYDMKNMEVESASLLGVLKDLTSVAISLAGGFSQLSEPAQMFISIAALGVVAVGALAAGFITYGAILPFITADTAIFGVTLSAAIWPATAVFLALAALAAGLVWLDEKTGVVSYSWGLLKDLFTITVDGILKAASILRDYVVIIMDDIKAAIVNMFPPGFLEGVGKVVDGIISQFSDMGNNIHEQALEVEGANNKIGNSTTEAGNQVTTGTNLMDTGFDQAGLSALLAGSNTQTGTGQMVNGMNAAGGAATILGGQVNGAVPAVNNLTGAMQASSSMAATFIGYLNQVSSSLASARENATNAAIAMQQAGSSMEQAQKAYHSYMISTREGNAPGISSGGGKGTGEGNVKIVAAPKKTLVSGPAINQNATNGWSVTNNNVKIQNNYEASKSSTPQVKRATGG